MNTGMMWFENDPKKSVTQKIREAADYYTKKYGMQPTLCLVNPNCFKEGETILVVDQTIKVDVLRSILPGHFWIGTE